MYFFETNACVHAENQKIIVDRPKIPTAVQLRPVQHAHAFDAARTAAAVTQLVACIVWTPAASAP